MNLKIKRPGTIIIIIGLCCIVYFVSQLVHIFSLGTLYWSLTRNTRWSLPGPGTPPPSPLPPPGGNTPSVTAGLAQALGNFYSGAAAATARSARGLSGPRPQRGRVHAGPPAGHQLPIPQRRLRSRPRGSVWRPRRPAARPCSQPPGGLACSSTASFPAREWATPPLRSSAPRRPCRAGRSRSPLRVRTRARAEGKVIVVAHARQRPAAARPPPARKRAKGRPRVDS